MTPLPSYTRPLARDGRAQARQRRIRHGLICAALCLGSILAAHTGLAAAQKLAADLVQAEDMRGM
jgi:TRAP-type mannitol/chloroaromatic compound transport system permease large subunit